jgi:hypothetical protein
MRGTLKNGEHFIRGTQTWPASPLLMNIRLIYALCMTITTRNRFFAAGIVVSLIALAVAASAAFFAISVYPEAGNEAIRRPAGLLQIFAVRFLRPSPYVSYLTMIVTVIYAFVTLIFIYYFFEKTQSSEILFFSLFVMSLAFEAIRILVPLWKVYGFPGVFLVISTRALLFFRYLGLFSLFIASVYASGLGEQKQENSIFILILVTLTLALMVPVDGLSWDSTLVPVFGHSTMFRMVDMGITGITVISFLIGSYTRGTKEYIRIGIGSFLVFWGRAVLFSSDTWVTPFPGLMLLVLGTWLVCAQLHRVYLWL